jgi:hypothetical protein
MMSQTRVSEVNTTDVKMKEQDTNEGFEENKMTTENEMHYNLITRYEQTDDLFGHIYGIERTLLIDQSEDTLLNLIEKITLIPESKLVLVEPMHVLKT